VKSHTKLQMHAAIQYLAAEGDKPVNIYHRMKATCGNELPDDSQQGQAHPVIIPNSTA